ncbi:Fc.00g054490.m01.CDS01 [Cosmosporella sp. VM-42]
MAHQQVNFQALRDEGLSGRDEKILGLYESALGSLPRSSLHRIATTVAAELEKVTLNHSQSTNTAELFVDGFWELWICIAKCIPHQHIGQALLLAIAAKLDASDRRVDEIREPSWKGLSCLGRCLRDNWIDPTFEPEDEEEEQWYSLEEWLNLNSFAARLLGARRAGWVNLAIWQLRHGLEEEASPSLSTNNRVAVACEWLKYSAAELFSQSFPTNPLSKAEKSSYRTGALFAGQPGLGLERWNFWKHRLSEIRYEVDNITARSIDEAINSMTAAENLRRDLHPFKANL